MTGDKALLSQFVEKTGPIITFVDNSKGYRVGYGRLKIGTVVVVDNALVDGLQHNQLSVSQFNDKGFKVDFDVLDCKIYHKNIGSLSLKGVRKESLFVADFDSTKKDKTNYFYSEATVGDSMMWHRKFSHLNFKTINFLMKKELV